MKRPCDVIIVGAGPAGCSAAAFLAREGHRALLLDKASFPRDKTCGDGISPPALDVLCRMGLENVIKSRGPWKINGLEVISPSGRAVRAEFKNAEGIGDHGYIWPRRDFDMTLLEHVRNLPNVRVLEDCQVEDLVLERGKICGVRTRHEGVAREFKGGVIIGADGAHSVLRGRISSSSRKPRQILLGVRAYFEDVRGLDRYAEVYWDRSFLTGYGWIFPTGERSANVGFGILCQSAKQTDLRRMLWGFLERNDRVKERFGGATLVEDSLKGWPVPLCAFPRRQGMGNVLLIGDAGKFADTLTGEGIYQALRSGEYAAKAISMALNDNGNFDCIAGMYERLCRRQFKRREYLLGYFLHRYVFNSFFLDFNIRRANRNPSMASALAPILFHRKSRFNLLL